MFTTDCILSVEPSRPDYWRLVSPLRWKDPRYGELVAPVGFETDLASIPRVLRNLPFLDVDGLSRRPAVLHDFLYSSRIGFRLGKEFADSFLRDALLAEKAGQATAQAFYWGVRIGGASHWDPLSKRTC